MPFLASCANFALVLLAWLAAPAASAVLCDLDEIEAVRRVWARHLVPVSPDPEAPEPPPIRLQSVDELAPAAEGLESPYDLDARFRSRYEMEWIGYLIHVTETCEAAAIHLITHVETTAAHRP